MVGIIETGLWLGCGGLMTGISRREIWRVEALQFRREDEK